MAGSQEMAYTFPRAFIGSVDLRRIFAAILFVFLIPASVFALGLGKIHVSSALNQPFQAEIELLALDGMSLEDIQVALASEKDFQRTGMERDFVLTKLRYRVMRDANGNPMIQVTSHDRITEPFLKFLLDVRWPSGQFFRAYTVLLDPPDFTVAAPERAVQPAAAESARPRVQQAARAAPSQSATQHTVRSGETLWRVALNAKPQGGTVEQTMVAIFNANPEAFMHGNMNAMKTGVTLRVPESEAMQKISTEQAFVVVAEHNQAWHQRRAVAPMRLAETHQAAAHGRIMPEADSAANEREPEFKPQPAKAPAALKSGVRDMLAQQSITPPKRVLAPLKLSQPKPVPSIHMLQLDPNTASDSEEMAAEGVNPNATGSTQTEKALRAELAISSEAINTVRQSNTELKQQLYAISQHNQMMQERFAAQERELAALRAQLNKQPVAMQGGEGSDRAMLTHTVEGVAAQTSAWSAYLPGSGLNKVLMAALLLLTLTGASLWWWRQRRMPGSAAPFVSPKVGPRFSEDASRQAFQATEIEDASDVDLTSEFTVPDDLSIEAPTSRGGADGRNSSSMLEVDPIEEADVYIAYDRFEDARQVLENSLRRTPHRYDLVLKLLEVHGRAQDKRRFDETLAFLPENYAELAPDVEQQVHRLKRQYWSEKHAAPAAKEKTPVAPIAPAPAVFEQAPLVEADLEADLPSAFEAPIQEEEDVNVYDATMDFAESDDVATLEAIEEVETVEDQHVVDFEPGLNTGLEIERGKDRHAEMLSDQAVLDEIEIDMPAGLDDDHRPDLAAAVASIGSLGTDDILSSKLDLAVAYINMGDKQGARELLEEVIAIGNEEQKRDAERILRESAL